MKISKEKEKEYSELLFDLGIDPGSPIYDKLHNMVEPEYKECMLVIKVDDAYGWMRQPAVLAGNWSFYEDDLCLYIVHDSINKVFKLYKNGDAEEYAIYDYLDKAPILEFLQKKRGKK